jgi:hypothetical protein
MHLYPGASPSRNWKFAISSDYPAPKTAQKKKWYYSFYKDIYIMMVSSVHSISKAGYYVAIVSTTVETNNPHQ